MKQTTLREIIERIAQTHLGVGDLTTDVRNLSVLSITHALSEAIKAGERIGYNEGFNNAKESCNCNNTIMLQ